MTPKEKYIQDAKDKANAFQRAGQYGRSKWWAQEAKRRQFNTAHLDDNLKLREE
jgi:hypothetical protein